MTKEEELKAEAIEEIKAEGLVPTMDVTTAWMLGWKNHARKTLKDWDRIVKDLDKTLKSPSK